MVDLVNIENGDTGLQSRTKINDSFDKVNGLIDVTASYNVATLIAAVTAGDIDAGLIVSTTEYHDGTGIGAASYLVVDAGSSAARPDEDGGKVMYAGNDGLYLSFVGNLPNPEQYGVLIDGTDSTLEFKKWVANNAALL